MPVTKKAPRVVLGNADGKALLAVLLIFREERPLLWNQQHEALLERLSRELLSSPPELLASEDGLPLLREAYGTWAGW